MLANRDDLGIEGNTARRLFWEMCASRQPVVKGQTATGLLKLETTENVARWADGMLEQWDKRWIADVGEEKAFEFVRPCPDCGRSLYKIECDQSGPEGLVCINGHGY